MKTFFYANQMSNCTRCSWQTCAQRYLSRLQAADELTGILTLTGDSSSLSSVEEGTPRHGDIIILYAENRAELERIIARKDVFDGMKKILVVADSDGIDGGRYHSLGPRFITKARRSIEEVDAVVRRMKSGMH